MTDDTKETLLTNHAIKDDFAERHKGDLSVGKYAQKKGIEFGLMAAGAGIGFVGGKHIPIKAFPKALREIVEQEPNFAGWVVGLPVGMTVGTLPTAYEHWQKEESKRYAVQEVNEDVANVKIRTRTDPELVEENQRLRGMLEEKAAETQALLDRKNEVVEEVTQNHLGKPSTKVQGKDHDIAEHTIHAVAEIAEHTLGH